MNYIICYLKVTFLLNKNCNIPAIATDIAFEINLYTPIFSYKKTKIEDPTSKPIKHTDAK